MRPDASHASHASPAVDILDGLDVSVGTTAVLRANISRSVSSRRHVPSVRLFTQSVASRSGHPKLGMKPIGANQSGPAVPDRERGTDHENYKSRTGRRRKAPMKAARRTRLLLLTVAGLAVAVALGACGSSDAVTARQRSGGGKIAFLLPETQTARYETQDKPLFEQKVQELCPDCEILYQNADQDPAKQQSQVRGRGHRGRRRDRPRSGRFHLGVGDGEAGRSRRTSL